jgi:hypothetical protein
VPNPVFEKGTGWVTEYTDAFTNRKKKGPGGIKFDIPFTNPSLQNSNYNSNRTKQNTIPKTQKISANTESQPKISDDLRFRRNPRDEILCREDNKNFAQTKSKSLTRSHTPQNPQSRSVTPNKGSPKKPTNYSQLNAQNYEYDRPFAGVKPIRQVKDKGQEYHYPVFSLGGNQGGRVGNGEMSGQKLFSGGDFDQEYGYENGDRGLRHFVDNAGGFEGGVRLRGGGGEGRRKEWNNGLPGDNDEVSNKKQEDRVRAAARREKVKSFDKDRRKSVTRK